MARTDTLGHFLTDVADAIREKTGSGNTIQASDFDTEIENIPSGELPEISEISDAFEALPVLLEEIVKKYNKRYNTPVTLYTPDINYQKYIIQKRSSNKYRIVWLADAYISVSTSTFSSASIGLSSNDAIKPSGFNAPITFRTNSAVSGGYGYTSSEMNTIDDCINAIQSPNTTYNLWTTNNAFGFKGDTPYLFPLSNTIIFTTDSSKVVDLLMTEQISVNETIEVIQ